MKIRPVAAELFHTDGGTDRNTRILTDMMKFIIALRNFANAPKNGTNTVSAVRRETLALSTSVSSSHGSVCRTAGRVTSVISG